MTVTKLIKGKHKATRPIDRQTDNSTDIANKDFMADEKRKLATKGPHTGTNETFQ